VNTDAPAQHADPTPSGPVDWSGAQKLSLISAVGGLALFILVGLINLGVDEHGGVKSMISALLTGWIYWISFPIGATALLMVHYLAKTSWGVLLKRFLEACTRCFPLMIVLFVPIAGAALVLKHDSPYWWVDVEHAEAHPSPKAEAPKGDKGLEEHADKLNARREASDKAVAHAVSEERKAHDDGNWSFLSVRGFIIGSVIYFAAWGALAFFLNKWGQDIEDDHAKVESSLEKLKNISGPGLIIHAIVLTAAASHWVMSLQEGWASTMFPVIMHIHQFLATVCFCVMLFLILKNKSPFKEVVRDKFQLDMGSLMLAFTLFWTYTSFSQMMLIWIGNLPEEIPFYLKRSGKDGWWWVSAGLIVFHFACPFILLLFRDIKLHPVRLRIMAVYLLVFCGVDVVWWIEPTFPHEGSLFILMDVGAIVGIGGLFGWMFINQLKKRPLLPTNELYQLPEGHAHGH
jgi:hypothetical protein